MLEAIRILEVRTGLEPAYAGRWFALYGADVAVHDLAAPRPEGLADEAGRHLDVLYAYLDARKHPAAEGGEAYDAVITDLTERELQGMTGAIDGVGENTIWCFVSPFGRDGSRKERDGSTLTTYALSGLMGVNGYPDRAPLSVWGYQFEHLAGLQAFSLLAGVLRLPADQRPTTVEVAGYEVAASLDYGALPAFSYAGEVRQPPGRNIGRNHPVTPLKCLDGSVFLNCVKQDQWERLTVLLGQPELFQDDRFLTAASRRRHADDLNVLIEPWFAQRTVDEVIDQCQTWRIPCAPFRSMREARSNPQLVARGFFDWTDGETVVPFAGRALSDAEVTLRRKEE